MSTAMEAHKSKGGALKRYGLGELGTGALDLSAAFGLEPSNKKKRGFDEESPSRAVTQHVLGRRSSTSNTSGESGRTTPSGNSPQPREEDVAMASPDVAGKTSLDDLDPGTGCEEDSECSSSSMPGLAERTKRELESERRDNTQKNVVERLESLLPGSSDESDDTQDDNPFSNQVFNPLFSESANQAGSREK